MRKIKVSLLLILSFSSLFAAKKTPKDLDYDLTENSFVSKSFDQQEINTYAVLPVTIYAHWLNTDENKNTKISFQIRNFEKIELLLLRMGNDCIERTQLDRILKEQKLSMAGITVDNMQDVGKLLNADAVMIATIPDMGYIRDQAVSITSINIKAVSVKTGKVLWKSILRGECYHSLEVNDQLVIDYMETLLYKKLEKKLKETMK